MDPHYRRGQRGGHRARQTAGDLQALCEQQRCQGNGPGIGGQSQDPARAWRRYSLAEPARQGEQVYPPPTSQEPAQQRQCRYRGSASEPGAARRDLRGSAKKLLVQAGVSFFVPSSDLVGPARPTVTDSSSPLSRSSTTNVFGRARCSAPGLTTSVGPVRCCSAWCVWP